MAQLETDCEARQSKRAGRLWRSLAALCVVSLICLAAFCGGFSFAKSRMEPTRRYFADDVTVYGKDADGEPFALELMLARRQEELTGAYLHYYDTSLVYRTVNTVSWSDKIRFDEKVEPLGVVRRYEARRADDLSARESLSLSVEIAGTAARVDITGLDGDFVIKNMPEYTKYGSVGKAQITVDGRSFEADALVMRIYSSDSAPYLFFDGQPTLRSETHGFAVWDDLHNFYYLDTSRVEEENPHYKSHTWLLSKRIDGTIRKAFSAELSFDDDVATGIDWRVHVADFDNQVLELQSKTKKTAKSYEGIASGTVSIPGETARHVEGVYFHHRYGRTR